MEKSIWRHEKGCLQEAVGIGKRECAPMPRCEPTPVLLSHQTTPKHSTLSPEALGQRQSAPGGNPEVVRQGKALGLPHGLAPSAPQWLVGQSQAGAPYLEERGIVVAAQITQAAAAWGHRARNPEAGGEPQESCLELRFYFRPNRRRSAIEMACGSRRIHARVPWLGGGTRNGGTGSGCYPRKVSRGAWSVGIHP